MLTALERDIIALMLEGPSQAMADLRAQLACALVTKREVQHHFVRTWLTSPADATRNDWATGVVNALFAEIPGLPKQMMFTLYGEEGALTELEGHLDGMQWPSGEITGYVLHDHGF